jgi:hypothetical protein
MTAPAASPLRQVHREHSLFTRARTRMFSRACPRRRRRCAHGSSGAPASSGQTLRSRRRGGDQTAPAFRRPESRYVLLPARPLLLLLHLQAEHRLLRPGSERNGVGHTLLLRLPCHADPPRWRASRNGQSHVTGRGRMRRPLRWPHLSPNARESRKRRRIVGLALRPESRPNPRRPSTCILEAKTDELYQP